MTEISKKTLTGERALFFARDTLITDCVFKDGESPLKECADIKLLNSEFRWKYPVWYSKNVCVENCRLTETARAGVWYTENARFTDCVILAPKTFRRCRYLVLENITMPDAAETLWNCSEVKLKNVTANGAYFAMNCKNVDAENLELTGDYCFDGAENVVVRNSRLMSKDSFWNSKNVTVFDSYISGEYLGWNSENMTFINCTLAFEYSTVDADICGAVDSIKNPAGGKITADGIGELIVEADRVDPDATQIICTEKAS